MNATNPQHVERVKNAIIHKLIFALGCDPKEATTLNWLHAAMRVVRDISTEGRLETRRLTLEKGSRQVYYLSMEFLMGRTFSNALIAEEMYDVIKAALEALGQNVNDIINAEPDPGLGNGGLGRLAACFLDSTATMRIPAMGYGIRYEYGMFRQEINAQGEQVEMPDNWTSHEIAWPYVRPSKRYKIQFGGYVQEEGNRTLWHSADEITALAHDYLVPGYDVNLANNLRLWTAQAGSKVFSLADFNRGDYFAAMEKQNASENVSRVLYPDDSTTKGRELRLRQEYFLCSASLQDIVRRHEAQYGSCDNLADKIAIHLNDTHPSLAIPELMRILIDEKGYDWQQAWTMTQSIFSYTNHTLMSEALETWPVDMLGMILPRHLKLILEINEVFLKQVQERYPHDHDLIRRVSIIDEEGERKVRMAWLSVIGSHKINGVAKFHSQLMVKSIFADFAKLFPERFTNVTNGVTPRRWIGIANPQLATLIDDKIGGTWRKDLTRLSQLNTFADDEAFLQQLAHIKRNNKQALADYVKKQLNITLNPDAIFDVQIKRIHEYKRQSMNVLHILDLYYRILENPDADWQPRVFIFAGKAASAYYMAKKIIHLINDVANIINHDARIRDLIKVVFIPNYGVSLAQMIIPAADISEQISLAGTEASGTSNMKFALNGALTVGTLDGANVEILDAVGKDNIFIFGNTIEEVEQLRREGYSPMRYIEQDAALSHIVQQVSNGAFSPDDPTRYQDLFSPFGDYYQSFADFHAYVEAQNRISEFYRDPMAWQRAALANIANMGYFSSDRSIMDYARNIWKIDPLDDIPLDSEALVERINKPSAAKPYKT